MPRLRCCVPFCRRTRKDDGLFAEWVCARHWTVVDRDLRRLKARAWRARRWRLHDLAWRRCKAQAITRAAGL